MRSFRPARKTLFSALIALALSAESASFDCRRASLSVERLICKSPALSALDSEMAERYGKALENSSNQRALKEQQKEWLRTVRNPCATEKCVLSAYRLRSQQFEWTTTHGKKNPICEELRSQENRRIGLSPYALEEELISDKGANFTHTIPNVDADGDKIHDRLLLLRSGSASLIPPDDSLFSITLSSTGTEYKQEAQRLYVIRYKSGYYLLTSNFTSEEGPVESNVYLLGHSGIAKVCSYECGLPDGHCAVNE